MDKFFNKFEKSTAGYYEGVTERDIRGLGKKFKTKLGPDGRKAFEKELNGLRRRKKLGKGNVAKAFDNLVQDGEISREKARDLFHDVGGAKQYSKKIKELEETAPAEVEHDNVVSLKEYKTQKEGEIQRTQEKKQEQDDKAKEVEATEKLARKYGPAANDDNHDNNEQEAA